MQGERFGDLFSDFSLPNTVGFNANRKLGLITDKLIKHMLIDLDDIQKSFYHLSSFFISAIQYEEARFYLCSFGAKGKSLGSYFCCSWFLTQVSTGSEASIIISHSL